MISSRDPRFDGQFVTAVRSTGIYCRPSCPARTPKPENVTFFPTSAAAHAAGYRACRRCLPEAVPGSPDWNQRAGLAGRAMRLIGDGILERGGVPALAGALGYTTRHVTRILTAELGAGPLALGRALRAQNARTLLVATELSITDVAFAAGFSSVRQFNDTVGEVYGEPPSAIRARGRKRDAAEPGSLVLRLPYRQPIDIAGVLQFLAARAIPGVETGTATSYARAVSLPNGLARFRVDSVGESLRLTARLEELRDLPVLLARVRRLFDLDADPVAIDAVLTGPGPLADAARARPGMRLPGILDPAEAVVRAIAGQQVTVAQAIAFLGRVAEAAGSELPEGDGVHLAFPDAAALAEGIGAVYRGPEQRRRALVTAVSALADGSLVLDAGLEAEDLVRRLTALPGVGEWTARYVAMRLLGASDVVLPRDAAVRAGAATLGLDAHTALAPYAPWRSYATLHLWRLAGARLPGKVGT